MDQRIENVARQVEAAYIPRYDMWQMDSETMEKFVALLEKEFEAKHFSAGYTQGRSDGIMETIKECADLNKHQAYELMGVIVDVEQGNGFDNVCLNTVKRVSSYLHRELKTHFGVE